jgi:hypothetical protein
VHIPEIDRPKIIPHRKDSSDSGSSLGPEIPSDNSDVYNFQIEN